MGHQERQINTIRKTPLVLQNILLEVLRNFFAGSSDQFQYSPDARHTKLIVEPAFRWNAQEVQVRPAVYIKRGAFQYARVSIDDVKSRDATEATTEYIMMANAMVTCMCISKVAGEVELLAEEVSEVLIAFKKAIREDFGFKKFEVASINEVGILEESSEHFACPILVTMQFEESWVVKLESLKLQQVLLKVHAALGDAVDQSLYGDGDYGEGPYDGGAGPSLSAEPGVKVTQQHESDNVCGPCG